MSTSLKKDADEIVKFIDALGKQKWLGSQRDWWPRFLFHFTDLRNAVQILQCGFLLSRHDLETTGLLRTDIASPSVIKQTKDQWKKYVRLYFRPRTPTQFHNEGFRPRTALALGAHCPVPIVFVFDSKKILTLKQCKFSNGNLAVKSPTVGETADFLANLPFQDIYHDTYVDEAKRKEIIYHRHAEVIVPNKLALDDVRYIWCRSQAEATTLKSLLPPRIRAQWTNKISAGARPHLFMERWNYVRQVTMLDHEVTFQYNPCSNPRGPFDARLTIVGHSTGTRLSWSDAQYNCPDSERFTLNWGPKSESYDLTLALDDHTAFFGRHYAVDDLPF